MNVFKRFVPLGLLAFAGFAQADYLAYSVWKNQKTPLPESIDAIEARYLVNLEWGSYEGRRSRVGVLPVDNSSSASVYTVSGSDGSRYEISAGNINQVPVNGIEAIVTDAMQRSGRFRLLERTVLGDVLGEQDLGAEGRVAKPSAAKVGSVIGAEYLVQVVVTDYETDVKGSDGGGGIGGLLGKRSALLGGLGFKSKMGRVGLNFRLIDATTSEVVYTKQIESLIKESGITFGGFGVTGGAALGGFLSNYSKTPIGQAVIAGIHQGVYDLAQQIGAKPATGSVVQVNGGTIILNLGTGSVATGDRMQLKRKGEELIDPETGVSLGSMDTTLGEIEVVQVQEKISMARSVNLSQEAMRSDIVISMAAPTPIEYAASWTKPKK
ncbi:MAG: CsgG/HfaB family protein [Woeseiaceae bacterium]|nr:CsgG/HfaB family protein [Woeseiaceae bacterium]